MMNKSQFVRDMLDSSSRSVSPVFNSDHSMDSSLPSTSTQNMLIDGNASENISFASTMLSPIGPHSIEDHPTLSNYSKLSVKRKLLNDSDEFILVLHNGKSDVWTKFQIVMHITSSDDPNSPNHTDTGFVACPSCKELYGKKTSTATLKRHKCTKNIHQNTIEMYRDLTNKKRKIMPARVKDEAVEKCVKYCSLDLRPMLEIKGNGFLEIGQFFLDIGAKYGVTHINDIIPHPTTVSRNIIKTTIDIRKKLFSEIYGLIKNNYCSSTCDMWTDNYKKNNYMSITCHYIDQNWVLNNRLLYTGKYPTQDLKTGDNIKKFMSNFFTKLSEDADENDGSDLMEYITFVTDQGSNMISALRNYNRLNCSAHLLNTVLRNVFDLKFLSQEDNNGSKPLEPIIVLMTECKSLVKFMKSSGKNNELSTVLVQEVETRWNTRLLMLQSVHKTLPEIIRIHGEYFGRIQNINSELLQNLIEFLKVFKNASDELEGDKNPTIQKVALYKCLIRNHLLKYANLEDNPTNDEIKLNEININSIMQKLGEKALEILNSKFKLSEEHKIAVFLWPKFKMLKMFSQNLCERSRIIKNIEKKLLDLESKDNVININAERNIDESNRPSSSVFSEWEDCMRGQDIQEPRYKYKKELENYREESFDIGDDDVLDFWSKQISRYPYLSKLARQILAIPSSSASSERSFSVAGRVIEERRSCLDGSTVDAILFLNNYYSKV